MEGLPFPLKIKVNISLRAKQYIQARDLIESKEAFHEITEHGMDIITEICDHGLNETEDFSEILICADMLMYVAKYFNPKLALISFLEQAEVFNFSPKFSVFVQPLKVIVARMPNKKPGNIGWVLKTLNSHLKTFESIPQVLKKYSNEEDNKFAIQLDPEIQQMLYFYNELCNFYEGLIPVLLGGPAPSGSSSSAAVNEVNINALITVLRDYLADLLGPPLIHINLSWKPEAEQSVRERLQPKKEAGDAKPPLKSDARLIAEKIMQILSEINLDANHFLSWIEQHKPTNAAAAIVTEEDRGKDEDLMMDPQLISVACYMYLLYGEKLTPHQLPSIAYSPFHIFHTNLYLIDELLSSPMDNEAFQLKGLSLARGIIELVNSASLFTSEAFDEDQSAFLDKVGTLVVFSESRPVRSVAVEVLTKYLWAFDAVGKRKVLLHLFNTVKDPGLFGHCITQLKEFINKALVEKENCVTGENTMQQCFLHSNLHSLLKPLCSLEHGVQTDLVGSCNKIIPLLNLLRYLFIRDGAKNLSGFKEMLNHVESDFFKPMRIGLDMSKAYYQKRMEEVQNSGGPIDLNPQPGTDMELLIADGSGGEHPLPQVENTKENQIEYINKVLGTLDLLESLWVRVNETSMMIALNAHKI